MAVTPTNINTLKLISIDGAGMGYNELKKNTARLFPLSLVVVKCSYSDKLLLIMDHFIYIHLVIIENSLDLIRTFDYNPTPSFTELREKNTLLTELNLSCSR